MYLYTYIFILIYLLICLFIYHFRISKFFVRHFETKITDSKIIFVERRFHIIMVSLKALTCKHLPFERENDITMISKRSTNIIVLSLIFVSKLIALFIYLLLINCAIRIKNTDRTENKA